MFHMEFVQCIFMMYHHTQFYIPDLSDSLDIAIIERSANTPSRHIISYYT